MHCHNDLGLAVANSLASVMNGARQVECTINGLGERAGNASLEEIVMAVQDAQGRVFPCTHAHRHDADRRGVEQLVSGITGFPVQPNKAIVGAQTRSRTSPASTRTACSSIRETYEIMRAEDVGWGANKLVLGKLSGPQCVQDAARRSSGIDLGTEEAVNHAFARLQGARRQEGRDLRRGPARARLGRAA